MVDHLVRFKLCCLISIEIWDLRISANIEIYYACIYMYIAAITPCGRFYSVDIISSDFLFIQNWDWFWSFGKLRLNISWIFFHQFVWRTKIMLVRTDTIDIRAFQQLINFPDTVSLRTIIFLIISHRAHRRVFTREQKVLIMLLGKASRLINTYVGLWLRQPRAVTPQTFPTKWCGDRRRTVKTPHSIQIGFVLLKNDPGPRDVLVSHQT